MQDLIKNIPSLDWDLSLKLAVGNHKLAKKLFNMMISSLPKEQMLINNALNNNQLTQLKEMIHKLHGACCYTGLPKLKHIAKNLETEIYVTNNNKELIINYANLLNQEIQFLINTYLD